MINKSKINILMESIKFLRHLQHQISTLRELHAQMVAGRYHIVLSEEAPFRVRTATLLKRALKEIHALGGDYVQVLLGA